VRKSIRSATDRTVRQQISEPDDLSEGEFAFALSRKRFFALPESGSLVEPWQTKSAVGFGYGCLGRVGGQVGRLSLDFLKGAAVTLRE
jgi:hypothetical protein